VPTVSNVQVRILVTISLCYCDEIKSCLSSRDRSNEVCSVVTVDINTIASYGYESPQGTQDAFFCQVCGNFQVYGRGDHADKQENVALADTWMPNFGIL